MLFNWIKHIAIIIIVVLFSVMTGCISENAEELFPANDAEAEIVYENSLKSIIENKCINCHNFHLEGSNRYDNFEKTKSSIGQMLERINANSNISMPPDESPQLTEEEKMVFQEFSDALNSDGPTAPETPEIKLTFTAYKYPIFSERGGVSGTFSNIQYQFNQDYTEAIDMLQDADVRIITNSVDIDGADGLRSMNVANHFFAFFSSTIEGKVISYDDTEAVISFTMNDRTQEVDFTIMEEDNMLILKGIIDDMNLFNWEESYEELETVCGDFHMNKVWPDIHLELAIPIDL